MIPTINFLERLNISLISGLTIFSLCVFEENNMSLVAEKVLFWVRGM